MTRYYPEKPKEAKPTYSPSFPENLLDERARDLWAKVWDHGAGYYTASSYEAIVDFCRLQVLANEAWDKIKQTGITTEGSRGQSVISPEFKVYKELQTMLTTARDRLGLSPRAGAELGLTTLQAQNQASKLERWKGA